MKNHTKSGFSLVEIAVVAVIIGLLAGGIFLGQSLLHASAIRAQVAQFEYYDQAINAFQAKYNAIPGDFYASTATAVGLSSPGAANGDGKINDPSSSCGFPTPTLYSEANYPFIQLYQAGLLKERFRFRSGSSWDTDFGDPEKFTYEISFPGAKLNNTGFFIFTNLDGSLSYFWGFNIPVEPAVAITDGQFLYTRSTAGVISPADAQAIDAKRDDGLPTTGRIRSAKLTSLGGSCWWYKYAGNDTTNSNCSNASTNSYNISNKNTDCRLIVDVQ